MKQSSTDRLLTTGVTSNGKTNCVYKCRPTLQTPDI
ncbi:hypothetical protein HDF14_001527 [Edaphobacter lichenicola]|uniref:Uncharacterized protein n=1 Tax=Tunturiibacter gelidiferens TaxID=3069689 RepID=A0A9X0U307_9BACT|nr:hypothetical protein [Edaphobacter lichenicola]